MSVKKYLDENTDKVEEKDTKVGKLKLNKKFVMGVAAVLLTATIAIGIVGCGNNKENPNPSQSGVVEQGQNNVDPLATPYYDSLYEDLIAFQYNASSDLLATDIKEYQNKYKVIFTEAGIAKIKEIYAKYIYNQTTVKTIINEIPDILSNGITEPEKFNKVSKRFLDDYILKLTEKNLDNKKYKVDREKLTEVLEKFIDHELSIETDQAKLKEIVGEEILLSDILQNNFGYNVESQKYDQAKSDMISLLIFSDYLYGYLDQGPTGVALRYSSGEYSNKKYGVETLPLEKLNIDLTKIMTKEDLNYYINLNTGEVQYETALNLLFSDYVSQYYAEKLNYAVADFTYPIYFKKNNGFYVLKANSNIKISEERFVEFYEKASMNIDELIMESKNKYGIYTNEGIKEIEKPKILQK